MWAAPSVSRPSRVSWREGQEIGGTGFSSTQHTDVMLWFLETTSWTPSGGVLCSGASLPAASVDSFLLTMLIEGVPKSRGTWRPVHHPRSPESHYT